jgi:hypothetical protein
MPRWDVQAFTKPLKAIAAISTKLQGVAVATGWIPRYMCRLTHTCHFEDLSWLFLPAFCGCCASARKCLKNQQLLRTHLPTSGSALASSVAYSTRSFKLRGSNPFSAPFTPGGYRLSTRRWLYDGLHDTQKRQSVMLRDSLALQIALHSKVRPR